jgi:hypothetical protein
VEEKSNKQELETARKVYDSAIRQLSAVLTKHGGQLLTHTENISNITMFLRVDQNTLGKHWPAVMAEVHRTIRHLKFGVDISKVFFLDSTDNLYYQWRLMFLVPPAAQAKAIQALFSAIVGTVSASVRVDEFPLVGGSTYSNYETKGAHKQGSGDRIVANLVLGPKVK